MGFIGRLFSLLGYKLERKDPHSLMKAATMEGALRRSCVMRKINPVTVIDVGAAEGKWTLGAMKEWPESSYLLLEPLLERRKVLSDLQRKYGNVVTVNCAAGSQQGEIDFYVSKDLDGSGVSDNGTGGGYRKVSMVTIDDVTSELKLDGPYLLKLDTHGFEVPILEGARRTLTNTKLLIIECYGFRIAPGSLLFGEMCEYLLKQGFRLVDIADVMLRPKDGAFWQCDAFFIPEDSECFSSSTYI